MTTIQALRPRVSRSTDEGAGRQVKSFRYLLPLLLPMLSACQISNPDMSSSLRMLSTPPTITASESRVTIPLQTDDSGRLYLTARFRNRELTLLVDTGAQTMVFSKAVLRDTSIKTTALADGLLGGITGPGKGTVGIIPLLSIDKIAISGLPAIFVDLKGWNHTSARGGARSIDGFLGSNLLLYLRAKIDYNKAQLVVHIPD